MLELMYITNNVAVAKIAEDAGVERVWIDLETLGKEERQKDCDSVKSHHSISDISAIKSVLNKAKLQVRINPINKESKEEIDAVIANGTDIIMLPYYKSVEEVKKFSCLVAQRAKTVLLLETKDAYECLDETLLVPGIDEIYIGLNDLHLSYRKTFMFELLADGTVESICKKIQAAGKPYGFGGIAKLGGGMLPAEKIIMEHYRLGSTRAILSRSFCVPEKYDSLDEVRRGFIGEMEKLRDFERKIKNVTSDTFNKNHLDVVDSVAKIVSELKRRSS